MAGAVLVVAVGLLVVGTVARLWGAATAGSAAWALATVVGLLPAVWWMVASIRGGRLGVDVIAVLALAGTLAVGEYLAGAVITVMLATGRVLEAGATARAKRELQALRERAPRLVHRVEGEGLTSPPLDRVVPGDLLVVQAGEVVPVDGRVERDSAVLDESALTGEPLPVERAAGEDVGSGALNAGGAFTMRATCRATDSTYAGIVRLVVAAQAQASSSAFVRLADRYAGAFLAVTLALAGLAWMVSGEAGRAVAVLVVATPCPLILAAPIAITAGISRAAARGVVVKGGITLERLAGAGVMLLDKTGTLTVGHPVVTEVMPRAGWSGEEILSLAASLDQFSPHVVAAAIVGAARHRGLSLLMPENVEEVAGSGIRGRVRGRAVALGKAGWVAPAANPRWTKEVRRRADLDGSLTVFVAVDGEPAGAILLDDALRPDAGRTIRSLRRSGISRIVLVSGDRADVAEGVGAVLGLDGFVGECSPADKVDVVRSERAWGSTIMVGDGINDAPALAEADVGVAMGARGATASSEAADVVLTVDRLDRLGEARTTARRTGVIARQSVFVGIGLSLGAMAVASVGLLAPALGALVQEGIDVAVILNALRARGGGGGRPPLRSAELALTRRFAVRQAALRAERERPRAAADGLGHPGDGDAMNEVREVYRFLDRELSPHEQEEGAQLYPVIDRVLGGDTPTATMSRGHVEIVRLTRRLGRILRDIDPAGPDDVDVIELRRLLYGLHAILQLHYAQEEEEYFSLLDEPATTGGIEPAPTMGDGDSASGYSKRAG